MPSKGVILRASTGHVSDDLVCFRHDLRIRGHGMPQGSGSSRPEFYVGITSGKTPALLLYVKAVRCVLHAYDANPQL